ncbi:MAG TPA: Crp/Fnr family transcriptional regulator [Thermoanaerobaculia bacterium]|nr:Crp/Fnr family transcriptional regulator [Thermoanaerobaculia bacterium]
MGTAALRSDRRAALPAPESRAAGAEARDVIRSLALFAEIEEPELDELLTGARTVRVESEQALFHQGDAAKCYFVLCDGRLALSRHSHEGDEQVVAVLRPVEAVGDEVAFHRGACRDLSARALVRSDLVGLDNERLRGLLLRSPHHCLRMMEAQWRRAQYLLEEIDQLALQSASQRVVSYLVAQCDAHSVRDAAVRIDSTKQLLAARLAMKPETLSRILSGLRRSGLVCEGDGGELTIPDVARLCREYRCLLCGNRRWGCPGPLSHHG